VTESSSAGTSVDPQLYARSFFDVYDDWYHDLDDPRVMVDALRLQSGQGAFVVELGSGTGRLSTPLHDAGFRVVALDASADMLAFAPSGPSPVAGDMAVLPLATACADAVLVAYNTFFNLASRAQQLMCFREIARVLKATGVVAIEAFVADVDDTAAFGVTIRAHPSRPDARLAIVTGPDAHDPDVIIGSHVELGATTTCRPWRLTYQSPSELDQCAGAAGLALRDRDGDWTGNTFDATGHRHVSWYEKA